MLEVQYRRTPNATSVRSLLTPQIRYYWL